MQSWQCRMPLLLMALLTSAVCVAAESRARLIEFDIPSLPLEESLQIFGAQAGVKLAVPSEIPARLMAPVVQGILSGEEALERLLSPFAIRATFIAPDMFVLVVESMPATVAEIVPITEAVPEAVVIGSRTLNTDQQRTENDASSYIVFTPEAMSRSGAMDARSFLETKLPAYSPRGVALGAAAIKGVSGQITMRGLPSSETVILFDGHRRAGNYAAGNIEQPDLALIPLAFLSRIDVRTASASALFGSDAVAGSVNLVRDRKTPRTHLFVRAEERAGTSSSTQQFGAEHVVQIANGWLAMDGALFREGSLTLRERNYVTAGRERMARNHPEGYADSSVPPLGALRNLRAVGDGPLPVGAGARFLFLPSGFKTGDNLATLFENVNQYSLELPASAQFLGEYSSVRPQRRTYSITTAGGWQFTDALSADVDIGFGSSLRSGRVSALDSAIGQVIFVPSSHAENPIGEDLWVTVGTDIADSHMSREDRSKYVTLGTDWRLSEASVLRLDHAWSAARSKIRESVLLGDKSKLIALLLNEPSGLSALTQAGMSLAENSLPEARNTLEETTLRFSSSNVIFPSGPGSLTLAAQRLYGKLLDRADDVPTAPFAALAPSHERIAAPREQRTLSLVGSAKLPIADVRARDPFARLSAELGIRRDSVLIEASPKAVEQRRVRFAAVSAGVAVRWQALDALTFRVQCSTGFLPPPLSSLSDKIPLMVQNLHLVDHERGDEPLEHALVISGGNYDLRPERSRSCGGGMVFTDADDTWRFSVDYNRLVMTKVVLTPAELFFRNPQRYLSEYASRVQRAQPEPQDPWSQGKITTIETWSINIARQEIETIDIQLSWRGRLLGGDVALSTLGSAQPLSTRRVAPFSEQENDAGIGNLASPKWRGTVSVTWSRSSATLGLSARNTSAYDVSRVDAIRISQGNGRVASQSYVDVFASYDVAAEPFGVAGTQLRFDATNVLGRDPPADLGELGYASRFGVEEFPSISLSVNMRL